MSYDLMVFNKDAAPRTKAAFMEWYQQQTEWTEDHSYDDPANTSPALRNWFMDMIQAFPAMNGPFASEDVDDTPHVSDYSIGRDVIYVAFAWSLAAPAYERMRALAEKHQVGFFDASGDNGDILFPEQGTFIRIDRLNGSAAKPWWKFW